MAPEPILEGLWRVGGGSWNGTVPALSAEDDANVYLLQGPEGLTLIDCAMYEGRAAIEANVRAAGFEPHALNDLLLTHSHWDHTQAAHTWRADYGLRTHLNVRGAEFLARGDERLVGTPLHGPEFPFTPFAVDHAVADGERFAPAGAPMTAHFLPGHTPDSTAFVLEHDGLRVGICGDIAFGPKAGGIPALGFLCALWLSDLDNYVASLRRLEALEVDLLVPGHGDVVRGREPVRDAVRTTLRTAERLAADRAVAHNFGIDGQ